MSFEVFLLNQNLWGFDLSKAEVLVSSPADSDVKCKKHSWAADKIFGRMFSKNKISYS